jgi:hypothetical protein
MSQNEYNSVMVYVNDMGENGKKITLLNANANSAEFKMMNGLKNTVDKIASQEELAEIKDKFNSIKNNDVESIKAAFKSIGFNIATGTINELLNPESKDKKGNSTKNIFDSIIKNMNAVQEPKQLKNFININELKTIIDVEKNHRLEIDGISYRDGNNLRYAFSNHKMINDELELLKSEEYKKEIVKRMTQGFYKDNVHLAGLLREDSVYSWAFNLADPSNQFIKFKELRHQNDKKIQDLTKGELWLVDLALFYEAPIEIKELSNTKINRKVRKTLYSTISDKNSNKILTTPMFDFTNLTQEHKDFFIKNVVKGELNRIIESFYKNTDLKNYDTGSKLFNFFPGLNTLQASKDGALLIERLYAAIESNSEQDYNQNKAKVENDILNLFKSEIEDYFFNGLIANEVANLKADLLAEEVIIEKKITTASTGEQIKYYSPFINFNDKKERGPLTAEELDVKLQDYIMNKYVNTVNTFALFNGDIALYYKSSELKLKTLEDGKVTLTDNNGNSVRDNVNAFNIAHEESFTNLGKRLALLIAPGTLQYEYTNKTNDYIHIEVKDYKSKSLSIERLKEIFKNQPKDLDPYLNKSIDTTDAQEYITWKGRLDERLNIGEITQEQYNNLKSIILDSANRELTEEEAKKLLPILFNIEKTS